MGKRVLSFIMSLSLILSSSLFFSVCVYADDIDHNATEGYLQYCWEHNKWERRPWSSAFEQIYDVAGYVGASVGALSNGDFKAFLETYDAFKSLYNDDRDYVGYDVNPDTNEIIVKEDFVNIIKQALKDYQKESCGYYLMWSTGFDDLPYDAFCRNKAVYDTLKNVLDTVPGSTVKCMIGTGKEQDSVYYDLYIAAFDSLPDVGFVSHWSPKAAWNYSMSTWSLLQPDFYKLRMYEGDTAIASWDDFKSGGTISKFTYYTSYHTVSCLCAEDVEYSTDYGFSAGWVPLVSRYRTAFRVFKSTDDMFDYSLNKRTVFTTEKFYEDTGDLTLSVDRMNETLEDIDGLLERFRESLAGQEDSGLTEDQLEKLLGAFLDEFFARYEQSGGGGSGSGGTDTGGGSGSGGTDVSGILGFLESILQALEEGFSGILMYLDEGFSALSSQLADIGAGVGGINESLEGMTQEQVEEKTDSFLSQLTSMFGDVADLVKTKFPFSIPWDLSNFLSVLGGDTVEVRAPDGGVRLVNAYAAVPVVYSDDAAVASQEMSDSGAPVFRLPLVVASAGIDEEIVVDLTSFEYVHVISRGMLTILYCLALINMTFKVVDLGKGLVIKDD